jgi:hypothetical protein
MNSLMDAPVWAMILLGFVLGYFLHVNLLLLISAVGVLVAGYVTYATWGGGLAGLLGPIASAHVAIVLTVMWGTYIATETSVLMYLQSLLR